MILHLIAMDTCTWKRLLGLLLLATTFYPASFTVEISDTDDSENTAFQTVLEKLQKAQNESEQEEAQRHRLVLSMINEKFPWVRQQNALPNYFIHKIHDDSVYSNGRIVFMQHHRSAGTAVRSCMDDHGRKMLQAWSPVMGSDDRADWDAGSVMDNHLREKLKYHRGMFAFNLCDNHQGECSYFTILRHPMERARSSYEYCKTAYGDEMCQGLNANEVDLREWIIHQGSLLFNQLLFRSDVCLNFTATKTSGAKSPPCWLLHKSYMDRMPSEQSDKLLQYILHNLDKWFAVIGIYEEMDKSLQMLEHLYKIPLNKCKHMSRVNKSDISLTDNLSNRSPNAYNRPSDSETDFLSDPEYLKYDYMVHRTLAPDIKIYEKAKEIFALQKQKFLNKI